jgi:hypothetical protein
MQAVTTIGLDIAKSVFQIHGVDAAGNVIVRRQLKRRYVLPFFQRLPPCLIGIEACASSHHWSRELKALGQTGQLGPMLTRNVDILHWGFALEFSTLYLTSRFTPGKLPKDEPLNQLVPLVEFSFDSVRGEKTLATMNPGLSYVAVSWQLAAEAIVPLNSEDNRRLLCQCGP